MKTDSFESKTIRPGCERVFDGPSVGVFTMRAARAFQKQKPMGEYAKYNGQEIKIGTCEQMYYLRADQVHLIQPLSGSVNPQRKDQAEHIRFRFPFPREDNVKPGAFEDFDYGHGLYGVEPPEDEGIEHYSVHFSNNGLMLSIPCPRSKQGKANPLNVGYNGYSGPVHIHSQRLVEGKLVLILRCGDCGALYRVPTLEEAQPVLDVLEKDAKQRDHETRIANERPGAVQCVSSGDYYREIARRIVAGYTEPNLWTMQETDKTIALNRKLAE